MDPAVGIGTVLLVRPGGVNSPGLDVLRGMRLIVSMLGRHIAL